MDIETKNKIKAILFIIIFLLLVAVIIYFITGNNEREYYSTNRPVQTDQVFETVAPTMEAATVETPVITATPVPSPTPTPVPTPEPTAEITPEPFIPGEQLTQGTFKSDTGALINLRADYNVTTVSENAVNVNVSVYLEHYSLHIVEGDTLHLALNGQYVTLHVQAIDSDDNALETSLMGTCTFTENCPQGSSASLPLNVEWQFNGSYHGVDLPVIECGGSIDFMR